MDLNLVVFFLVAWLVALTQAFPPSHSIHSLRAEIEKIAGKDFIINVPKEVVEASRANKIKNQGVNEGAEDYLDYPESDYEFDDDMIFYSAMQSDGEQGMDTKQSFLSTSGNNRIRQVNEMDI